MQNTKQAGRAAAFLALGLIAVLPAARADVKLVQSTVLDSPQLKAAMQSMSAQQRAKLAAMGMGGTIVTTTYVSGGKVRADMGPNSYLIDSATHKMTVINRTAHTYSTRVYRVGGHSAQATAHVRDTGQTKMILGHRTHRYTLSSSGIMGGQVTGELWAAADLPQPASFSALLQANPALQSEMQKVKGMPLLQTFHITGSPAGDTTVKTVTKSISTTPLPASIFSIPAGYNKAPEGATGSPGMGGSMGG